MKTSNMREAKTHLSRLVDQALAGEEIIIARSGKPLVRLVPVEFCPRRRTPDRLKGKIWMAPDFDETPQALIDAFHTRGLLPTDE